LLPAAVLGAGHADRWPFARVSSGSPFARYPEARLIPGNAATGERPLAMASADLTGDGLADLVVSTETGQGTTLRLYPGNLHTLFPHHPEAKASAAAGGDPDMPFHPPSRVWTLPDRFDQLQLVDFDQDGALDIVVGQSSSAQLLSWRADREDFEPAIKQVELPGPLVALAVLKLGNEPLPRLLAVTQEGPGSRLSWFERGASAAASWWLPGQAKTLQAGDLNGDGLHDLLMLHEQEIWWLPAQPAASGSVRFAMPRPAESGAAAWQSFALDQALLDQPIVSAAMPQPMLWRLDADGGLSAVAFDRDVEAWLPLPNQLKTLHDASQFPAAQLHAVRLAAGVDHALMLSTRQGAIRALALRDGASAGQFEARLPGEILQSMAMRLNPDAMDDLVFLTDAAPQPIVVLSKSGMNFLVENTMSLPDCNTTDDFCSTDLGAGGGCGSGGCTLRAALQQAAATAGPDTISFSIGGEVPHGINDQELVLTDATTLDATSQPGFAGLPVISVAPPSGRTGLFVSGGSVVRGLLVHRAGTAIAVCGNGDILEGNITGYALGGGQVQPGNVTGISIGCDFSNPSNTRIGGTTLPARNFSYGNTGSDLAVGTTNGCSSRSAGSVIEGNYFGFEPDGTTSIDALHSVSLCQFDSGTLGGTSAAARNFMAGGSHVDGSGVFVADCCFAQGNLSILGNRIGGGPLGQLSAGLGWGIRAQGQTDQLRIGSPTAGNEVIGHAGVGVALAHTQTNVVVEGNSIGEFATGSAAGNGNHGIYVENAAGVGSTPAIRIGGTNNGQGNLIAHNAGAGVLLKSGLRSEVVGNRIFDNVRMAIDLECFFPALCSDGPTPNDPLDADDCGSNCANGFQNHPDPVRAGVRFAQGRLDSAADQDFRIDVYATPACAPGAKGELDEYLGSAMTHTDGTGRAQWFAAVTDVPANWLVVTTATDATGNTSEPSGCTAPTPDLLLIDGFETL
jgi:hypothetical protein